MATNCLRTILIIIVLTFTFGCKKNIDYRDKYTGNFNFSTQEDIGYQGGDTIHYDTSFYYSGKITKGTNESEIRIYYRENGWADAVVGEDGTVSKSASSGLGIGFSGKFETIYQIAFIYVQPFATYQKVIGIRR